ncbi:MAG: 2-dehydropantoate 2-reductase [Acidimicrobiales bacterium]
MNAEHPRRVAVVGAGSVGGVFAAHLSAVHDVVACVRRGFDQYKIDSPDIPFSGPAQAVTSVDELPWDGPADAVFVGLKSHHTEGAAEWFAPLCGPETLVVVMQNGIEGRERLTPYVNGAAVVPAVVYCGAELLAPGHVRHSSKQQLIVPNDADGVRAGELSEGTPLDIGPSDGHERAAWIKLGINSVANGLTALTGRPMEVFADPGVAKIGEQLLTECWTVGQTAGVDVKLDGIPKLLAGMAKGGGRTSMQQDSEAGRSTEHDAIHGAVIRKGLEHGVPTPTTVMIHDLLAARSAA